MNGFGRGISLGSLSSRSRIGTTTAYQEPLQLAPREALQMAQTNIQVSDVLQITKFREEIIKTINSHEVTLISAETGSGKVRIPLKTD